MTDILCSSAGIIAFFYQQGSQEVQIKAAYHDRNCNQYNKGFCGIKDRKILIKPKRQIKSSCNRNVFS